MGPGRFVDFDRAIGADLRQDLPRPRGPGNVEALHDLVRTEPEEQTRIVLRQVASGAPGFIDLDQIASLYQDPSTETVAVAAPSPQAHGKPVVVRGAVIAQQQRLLIGVDDENVQIAVVIVIASGGTAANEPVLEGGAGHLRHLGEEAVAVVYEQLILLPVGGLWIEALDVFVDMPVGDKEIHIPVGVGVEQVDAESQAVKTARRQTGAYRHVGKATATHIPVERIAFPLKIRHHQGEAAVTIDVAGIDTHRAFGPAGLVVGDTGCQGDVREEAVAVVAEEKVGSCVVALKQVDVAISVVVEEQRSELATREAGQTCRLGHIDEATAVVAVQHVAPPGELGGRQMPPRSPQVAAAVQVVILEIVIQVVGHVEVEVAIQVVVGKGATRRPAAIPGDAGRVGHVRKAPVLLRPLVAVEDIGAVVGHEQILIAIVVVVADGAPHAVGRVRHRLPRRDLTEVGAAIAIERITRRGVGCVAGQIGAIDDVEIDTTVVVVVEEGGTRADGFDAVLATRTATGVVEIDPRSSRDVDESQSRLPLRSEDLESRGGFVARVGATGRQHGQERCVQARERVHER